MMSGRHESRCEGSVPTGRFSSSMCWYVSWLLVNKKRDRTITAYVVGS